LLAHVQAGLQQGGVAARDGVDPVAVHVVEETGRVGLRWAGPDETGEKRAAEQG
jgi:hypothetical protein